MNICTNPDDPFPRDPSQVSWWGRDAWWSAGIPDLHRQKIQNRGWDAIDHHQGNLAFAIRKAKEYGQWPWKHGMYLCGPVGCGKTLIAVCAVREMILSLEGRERRLQAAQTYGHPNSWYPAFRFVSTQALITKVRSTFFRGYTMDTSAQDVVRVLRLTDVLALDDIGSEQTTEWVQSLLFDLIDSRYNSVRATIFTSNLSLDELGKRLTSRLADRIAEMCAECIVRIDAPSYRLHLASGVVPRAVG